MENLSLPNRVPCRAEKLLLGPKLIVSSRIEIFLYLGGKVAQRSDVRPPNLTKNTRSLWEWVGRNTGCGCGNQALFLRNLSKPSGPFFTYRLLKQDKFEDGYVLIPRDDILSYSLFVQKVLLWNKIYLFSPTKNCVVFLLKVATRPTKWLSHCLVLKVIHSS